jgi:hypothetical protein
MWNQGRQGREVTYSLMRSCPPCQGVLDTQEAMFRVRSACRGQSLQFPQTYIGQMPSPGERSLVLRNQCHPLWAAHWVWQDCGISTSEYANPHFEPVVPV